MKIYHENQPNVGKYTIYHGWYGFYLCKNNGAFPYPGSRKVPFQPVVNGGITGMGPL